MKPPFVVILSAGRGERMASPLPKTLHPVGGKPILARLLQSCLKAELKEVQVTVRPDQKTLIDPIAGSFNAKTKIHKGRPGTAGSLMSADLKEDDSFCLVLNGDHPLISPEDLKSFVDQALALGADLVVGSSSIEDPESKGRIVREGEFLKKIVEPYDLAPQEQHLSEVNTGIMLIRSKVLKKNLPLVTDDNPKQEYPLTDLASIFFEQGLKTKALPLDMRCAFGVNTQEDLALANTFCFEQKTKTLMKQGVIFPSPGSVYIEDDAVIGGGSIIYPGVYIKGQTKIGSFSAVENNSFIFDSIIDPSVYVKAHSYLEGARVGSKSVIGPFARLRPGAVIGKECKVGSFAEVKNTRLEDGSKASHQCYLGDAVIGRNVNIGAGAVICNFAPDKTKRKTRIQDHSFIGSGSMLVAPLEIGQDSVIAAGSVITKNVPPGSLAIERSKQEHKKNKWSQKSTKSSS